MDNASTWSACNLILKSKGSFGGSEVLNLITVPEVSSILALGTGMRYRPT